MDLYLVAVLLVTWLANTDRVRSSRSSSRLGFQRSEGTSLNDWCIKDTTDYKCEVVNGADCVDVTDGSVLPFTQACKCGSTFEPYTTNSGAQRCRMKWTSGTALTAAKCQIDEDCQHWYPTAICNPLANGLPGTCDCPPDFTPDTANQPKCRALQCSAGNDADCVASLSSGSTCDTSGSKPICKCKASFYLALVSGKQQCVDFKNAYTCSGSNLCPAPLTCDSGTTRCVCPTGFAISLKPGTIGQAECTVPNPIIGGLCATVGVDTDCPPNSECKSLGGKNICVCKPYFRSSAKGADGKSTCQTILGICCRTAADCATKIPTTSVGTLGPLQCLKMPTNAARGVCACASGMFWDWNNLAALTGTTSSVMPGCANNAC